MPKPTNIPSTLNAEIYPASGPFPEQSNPTYSASSGLWAACFSGGGPRAFSAALGQMRGLNAAGVLPFFGAISCVSGGSWFGAPFSFAPGSFSLDELLGAVTAPGEITVAGLQSIPQGCLGTALLNLTDTALAARIVHYIAQYFEGKLPFDKIWSRLLNDLLLEPFALDDTSSYFTLDQASVNEIVQNNPGLAGANFFTLRPNQPYVFFGGTQIYPNGGLFSGSRPKSPGRSNAATGSGSQVLRHFEYSVEYSGTAQLFSGAGCGGADIGGGFVQNLGFDSQAPASPAQQNLVQSATPAFPFLLCDAIGSSSAAIAGYLDKVGLEAVFPEFSYWPLVSIGSEQACTYSFGDGGILENTGIVPLLRRHYKVIFAFVNTPYPFGSTDPGCVDGVDGQITRLFGYNPKENFGDSQETQVFPSSQLSIVVQGLQQAKNAGGPVFAVGQFTIQTPNNFSLDPYPGDGEVTIFWMYNDINQSWKGQLSSDVQALLASTSPSNYMKNFPNYATAGQNDGEALLLTAQQVNLLADMWSFSMTTGFADTDRAFGASLPRPCGRA